MFRILALQGALLFATTAAALAADIEKLPGYSKLTVSADFIDYLNSNKSVASVLEKDADLSRLVLTRVNLQKQLLAQKTTLESITKTYFPHRVVKAKAAPKHAEAEGMTQRAVASVQNVDALKRAQTEIDKVLHDTAQTTVNQAAVDEVLAVVAVGDETHAMSSQNLVEVAPAVAQTQVVNIDVNAVPTGSGLDANGWPKYLNVPADCPAARTDLEYIHYPVGRTYANYGTDGGPKDYINPYKQGQSEIILADNQLMAFPIHTPLIDIEPSRPMQYPEIKYEYIEGGIHGHAQTFQIAFSHCPGAYDNVTPAGAKALNDSCVMPMHKLSGMYGEHTAVITDETMTGGLSHIGPRCALKPNTRYYVNFRPSAQAAGVAPEDETKKLEERIAYFTHAAADGSVKPETAQRNIDQMENNFSLVKGKKVVRRTFRVRPQLSSFFPGITTPPYAGPCLNEAPYPVNYASASCGERIAQPCDTAQPVETITCYDPENLVPPQNFTRSCVRGTHVVWTEGYRKAANSRYVCSRNDNEAATAVCAAHNEGRVRISKHMQSERTTSGSEREDVCAWNAQKGRFEWTLVSGNPNGHAPSHWYWKDAL